MELKGLPPEHGREDVVRVIDHAQSLDQAFLPPGQMSSNQKVVLAARIERSLQVTVGRPGHKVATLNVEKRRFKQINLKT